MPTIAPPSDGNNNGPGDPPNSYQLGEHRIRLDFSYSEVDRAPNVPVALFEIVSFGNRKSTISSLLTMPATSSNLTTFH
jgi:hypothetical protein